MGILKGILKVILKVIRELILGGILRGSSEVQGILILKVILGGSSS